LNFETDVAKFRLDMQCPNCGIRVRAVSQTKAIYHISECSDQYAYLIVRCPRDVCGIAFVMYDRLNNRIARVFPFPRTDASTYHEAIPQVVRDDFAEARRCWCADAYKGVVVMCRRAIQAIAVDKGAKGDHPWKQIDNMLAEGVITKSLQGAAHEVRFFGAYGAHPRDDGLDSISADDALAVMEIVEQFLEDLYVRPWRIDQLRLKRTRG